MVPKYRRIGHQKPPKMLRPRYHNPWESYVLPRWHAIFAAVSSRSSDAQESGQSRDIQVVPLKFEEATRRPQMAWLGHASVYVLLPGSETLGILFDPIFSDRCSPIQWCGPKRRITPPCRIGDLPRIDYVVISHDHYDHLDKQSIRDIERYYLGVVYLVAKGLARWFSQLQISRSRVLELGWWEEREVGPASRTVIDQDTEGSSRRTEPGIETLTKQVIADDEHIEFGASHQITALRFICTPAQHNSGRGLLSQNKTLWASWVVEYILPETCEPFRIFFGGDTGYKSAPAGPACPIFREIAERYGPPDVSFLPLAAGSVLPFIEKIFRIKLDHAKLTSAIHCMPNDAVEIHQAMQSRMTIGIHWGTFTTRQHTLQTIEEVDLACERRGVLRRGAGSFKLVDAGRVMVL